MITQTKVNVGIVAGLLASASLFSTSPAHAWSRGVSYPQTNCANAIALNAVVGCTAYGHGFELSEFYDDGFGDEWAPIENDAGGWSAGTAIANDIFGALWMVDSTGAAYYGSYTGSVNYHGGTATGGTPAVSWQPIEMTIISANPGTFTSIAAGDPYYSVNEVWATDSNGNVYMWTGRAGTDTGGTINNGWWWQVAAVPNGAAKVGVFAELENNSTCAIHTPWVIDRKNNIYKYEFVNSQACVGGSWVQQPGAAIDITSNDYVLGTDNQVFRWNPETSSWTFIGAPSGVVLTHVGSALNATNFLATDTTKNTWFD